MEFFVFSPILLFLLPWFTYTCYQNGGSSTTSFYDATNWETANVIMRRIWFDSYNATWLSYQLYNAFVLPIYQAYTSSAENLISSKHHPMVQWFFM